MRPNWNKKPLPNGLALPPFFGGSRSGWTGQPHLNDCAFAGRPRPYTVLVFDPRKEAA